MEDAREPDLLDKLMTMIRTPSTITQLRRLPAHSVTRTHAQAGSTIIVSIDP